jgi:hypothetical protein
MQRCAHVDRQREALRAARRVAERRKGAEPRDGGGGLGRAAAEHEHLEGAGLFFFQSWGRGGRGGRVFGF